jgi:hypothetical protein
MSLTIASSSDLLGDEPMEEDLAGVIVVIPRSPSDSP